MDRGKKVGVIDVGSNSIRLLVGQVNSKGELTILKTKLLTTRLGEGINLGFLLPKAMQRTVDGIKEFLAILAQYEVENIGIFATSAVRDAINQVEFKELVLKSTGKALQVLSGEEEAFFSYKGVKLDIPKEGLPIVMDLGGGSTEFIWFENNLLRCESCVVGAVRMTERAYLEEDILARLKPTLDKILSNVNKGELIGIGGTITTLAAMELKLEEYDPKKVQRYKLNQDKIIKWKKAIEKMDLKERKNIVGLGEDRADIILAGIKIILLIMQHLGISWIKVSEFGLLEGLALKINEKS